MQKTYLNNLTPRELKRMIDHPSTTPEQVKEILLHLYRVRKEESDRRKTRTKQRSDLKFYIDNLKRITHTHFVACDDYSFPMPLSFIRALVEQMNPYFKALKLTDKSLNRLILSFGVFEVYDPVRNEMVHVRLQKHVVNRSRTTFYTGISPAPNIDILRLSGAESVAYAPSHILSKCDPFSPEFVASLFERGVINDMKDIAHSRSLITLRRSLIIKEASEHASTDPELSRYFKTAVERAAFFPYVEKINDIPSSIDYYRRFLDNRKSLMYSDEIKSFSATP